MEEREPAGEPPPLLLAVFCKKPLWGPGCRQLAGEEAAEIRVRMQPGERRAQPLCNEAWPLAGGAGLINSQEAEWSRMQGLWALTIHNKHLSLSLSPPSHAHSLSLFLLALTEFWLLPKRGNEYYVNNTDKSVKQQTHRTQKDKYDACGWYSHYK